MRIVIVGAALAGPTAAARAREVNEKAEIILLERNTRVSYAMAGLAHHLSGEVSSLDELNRERESFFRAVYNIDVRTRTEVVDIQPKQKLLTLKENGKQESLSYDKLIYAAGAASLHPVGAPKDAANFRYFRTLEDLAAIRAQLDSGRKRFVVLGAGSMGLEAVDGLVRGSAEVTLIEKKAGILPEYSREIANTVLASLRDRVRIIAGFKQIDFTTHNGRIVSIAVDNQKIETDFVVSAIGVKPRTEILKRAGVRLLTNGSIPINDRCQTNVEDIYACSICVSIPVAKTHHWIAQAALSDKTAQVAGENAAGGRARLAEPSGAQILRLPSIEVGRVGNIAAKKRGVERVFVHTHNMEPYMPKASPLALLLYYEKKSQRVIALEAVGNHIKARLDAIATAIAGKLRLKDLAYFDFAYTPALGTARDALNVAALVALQQTQGITDMLSMEILQQHRKKYLVLDVSEEATHAGIHDIHIPLEQIRSSLAEIRETQKRTKSAQVAVLSETGRRGYLALRILKNAGIKAQNIAGGKMSLALLSGNA